MIKRLLSVTGYPGLLVFALAGVAAIVFAYATVNLLDLSMANLRFLRQHGWEALISGGFLQLVIIAFYGFISLAAFFLFKICEMELMDRYRRWIEGE